MNAEQHHSQLPNRNAGHSEADLGYAPALSALADGEISASELDALLNGFQMDIETLSRWQAYEAIGDALRGQRPSTSMVPANDFLAAVRLGLQAHQINPDPATPELVEALVLQPEKIQRKAANDDAFHWKLVAGFASVAAVVAVSWNVLVGSGGPLDDVSEPQLALTAPSRGVTPTPQVATVAVPAVPSSSSPVAVNTGQGVLIRDAQLEALLAEHRQHGGMSALQSPSGFIRSATYDSAGR